jgi:hypothetical protein
LFDFRDYVAKQQAWSLETFGPGMRTKGIIKHIEKELREIENNPGDTEEWVDVVILGLDGAYRTGVTPEKVVEILRAKQVKNFAREWPDWRTVSQDQPIEHVRTEQEIARKEWEQCIKDAFKEALTADDLKLFRVIDPNPEKPDEQDRD